MIHTTGASKEIALFDFFTCTEVAGFTDGFVSAMIQFLVSEKVDLVINVCKRNLP
jgi:hypothetical protein